MNKQAVTDFILDNVDVMVRYGDEVRLRECLFCGRSRTMRLNTKTWWFICSHPDCDTRGRHLRLIQAILGCDRERAAAKFIQLLSGVPRTTESNEELRELVDERHEVEEEPDRGVDLPDGFKLCNDDPEHWANVYLRGRGVSQESVEMWGIGYAERGRCAGRVIVPVRTNDLTTWVARATDPEDAPKYRTPFHGPSDVLFGYNELVLDEEVVVPVEGVFDAIRLWSYGIPAVAYLKDGLSLAQVRLLEAIRPKRLIQFPDGGDKRAQLRAIRDGVRLASRFPNYSVVVAPGDKKLDPDSCDWETALELLASARPQTKNDLLRFKLEMSS